MCIVSGVGPGLGRQAARALAAHGADLVLAARRQSSLEEVGDEVQEMGARALVVPTDITDPEACARVASAAVDGFGGVDVLVNNAFRFDAFKSFEEVDLAVWRKIMDTNLFGSLQMTRAVLPAIRARGGGSVVMVASMVARQPQPVQGGYAISKGALLTATTGARLRARSVQRPRQRRRTGVDGRSVGGHLHRDDVHRSRRPPPRSWRTS